MLLFVGLGNPGTRYAGNRHNVGAMAIEAIARRHGYGPPRKRFHGALADGLIAGERVLLLTPHTYMNESGRAVAEALHFYKLGLPALVVFHDELDLPPLKLRVKTGGGIAGHNGLRSISAHVGNDYRRVRIGIGHPGAKELVHAYVLQDFTAAERAGVAALCEAIADNVELLVRGQDATFQNKVHLAMTARGFGNPPPKEEAPRAPGDSRPGAD